MKETWLWKNSSYTRYPRPIDMIADSMKIDSGMSAATGDRKNMPTINTDRSMPMTKAVTNPDIDCCSYSEADALEPAT